MSLIQWGQSAVAISLMVAGTVATGAEMTGAGATFPAPIYAKWAEIYLKQTGHRLNYQAIGSGGGIKQIKVKTVDFGATDAPMSAKQLKRRNLLQFPAVIGGIVPVVNLKGVQPGQLKLDGKTLAAIYSGAIKKWNDPAIVGLNKDISLPGNDITVVYRSDSSGTTAVFTTYLAQVEPTFKDNVGAAKTVNWRVGVGGKGNAGVAANVLKLKNSIGYVEYAYAKQSKMSHASMINKAGKEVQPDANSFAAAAADANWDAKPGFGISLNNQDGDNAWPITAASFILMYREPEDPKRSADVLGFFQWALTKGTEAALELDFVPLPEKTVAKVQAAWKEIVGDDGKPVM